MERNFLTVAIKYFIKVQFVIILDTDYSQMQINFYFIFT